MANYEISLGNIHFEPDDSDEMLMQRARAHLPTALRSIGEQVGEASWKTLADSFRNSPFAFDLSQKAAHVRDMADKYERNADHNTDHNTREETVQMIFDQLKARRDK